MKVNIHVTEKCNFHCRQCYAKFDDFASPTLNEWKKVIDNCFASGKVDAFNFAGGEPLLYNGIDELIEYAHSLGTSVSIITNGYLINDAWIERNANNLDTIGFSIDSFSEETLRSIGRCTCSGRLLETERLVHIIRRLKECNPNIKIKLNTVVSALNKDECPASEIVRYNLPVSRWKLLRMCPFSNEEFNNYELAVTDEEYSTYVSNCVSELNAETENGVLYTTTSGMELVAEDRINGGYIMIDAGGYLVDDTLNTNYTRIINCINEDFSHGLELLNFDTGLYNSRYSSN